MAVFVGSAIKCSFKASFKFFTEERLVMDVSVGLFFFFVLRLMNSF